MYFGTINLQLKGQLLINQQTEQNKACFKNVSLYGGICLTEK
jgi:hypothetical protein